MTDLRGAPDDTVSSVAVASRGGTAAEVVITVPERLAPLAHTVMWESLSRYQSSSLNSRLLDRLEVDA